MPPAGTRYRAQNSSVENLIIIEAQTGEYFGEDDIERFEDDYGRT
jgi:mannose-6-phosphate isomerase